MFDNLSDKLQRVFKNLARRGQTLGGKHGSRAARDPRGAARSRRAFPRGQTVYRSRQGTGHGAGSAHRAFALPAGGQDRPRRNGQDAGHASGQAADGQRAAQRLHDRRAARLRQNHFDGQTRALAVEKRQLADDGFGRRLPSGGAQTAQRLGARSQAADLRRHVRRKRSRSI